MRKLIAVLLLLAMVLAGCASGKETEGFTFTDDLGREVTVKNPQRVAALLGSYADIWFLAGGTVCASSEDAWDDLELPMPEDAVNLGSTHGLSLESLFAANPDFVIGSTNSTQNLEWQQPLESAGIPVAYFEVLDFEDYLRVLEICTRITGKTENFTKYGTDVKDRIEAILARNADKQAPTVLVMRASGSSIRAKNSKGTVLGAMLKDFGCVNIADSDDSLLENLSIESISLANPDYIFFVQAGSEMDAVKENVDSLFRENPLWKELDAVKEGRMFFMEKRLFNMKPNGQWADAYEIVEKILYEAP